MEFDLATPLVPCRPPLWARGGHMQTLLGHLLPSTQLAPEFASSGKILSIEVLGGDRVIAHHYPAPEETTAPQMVVSVFHGLGGESHGSYMQRTALLAHALGAAVLLVNHRGCGAGRGMAREPYHSGRSEDLSAVIGQARKIYPGARHVAVGFSLSANALLLLAAGVRATAMPDAAIAVNAPINLARSAELLIQGVNRIYDMRFMRDMRDLVASCVEAGHDVPKLDLPPLATLRDFDAAYTAPAGGFASREHYYETCSAAPYLSRISIPTMVLTAADDPFVDVVDYRRARLSSLVRLHIEPTGGHMGYLACDPVPELGTHRWLDHALLTFLRAAQAPAPAVGASQNENLEPRF